MAVAAQRTASSGRQRSSPDETRHNTRQDREQRVRTRHPHILSAITKSIYPRMIRLETSMRQLFTECEMSAICEVEAHSAGRFLGFVDGSGDGRRAVIRGENCSALGPRYLDGFARGILVQLRSVARDGTIDGWMAGCRQHALIDTLGLARIRAKQRERVVLRAHRLSSELGQSKIRRWRS